MTGKGGFNMASGNLRRHLEGLLRLSIQSTKDVVNVMGFNRMTLATFNGDDFRETTCFKKNMLQEDSGSISMAIRDIIIGYKHKGDIVI